MIKCIIFDCDGTLVDSEYLNSLGLEQKLKQHGIEKSAQELMQRYRGMKFADTLLDLAHHHEIEFDQEFTRSYRVLVEQLFEQHLQACEGVKAALEMIDLPLCVASGGPKDKIIQALDLTGLAGYFGPNIYSSYDLGSWKPEPGLFIHVAQQMGLKPSECVVVEDSLVGITAATAAAMHTVLYDPDQQHQVIENITHIHHMNQLPSVIERHRQENS